MFTHTKLVVLFFVIGPMVFFGSTHEARAQTAVAVTTPVAAVPTLTMVPVRRGLFGRRIVYRPTWTYTAAAPVTTFYAPATTVVQRPVTTFYAPATTVVQRPVTTFYAPATTVVQSPVTTYYAPATTVVQSPVTTFHAPATTVVQRPVTTFVAPAPVTTFYAPIIVD